MEIRPAAVLLAAVLLSGCSAGPDGVQSTASAGPSAPVPTPTTATSVPAAPSASPTVAAPPTPDEPEVRTVSVTYAGGEVTGTSGREEVELGEQVVLRFVSDVAEEIHVHGYDREAALPAGETVEVALLADIPGVFEVELHDSGKVLYQLRVS